MSGEPTIPEISLGIDQMRSGAERLDAEAEKLRARSDDLFAQAEDLRLEAGDLEHDAACLMDKADNAEERRDSLLSDASVAEGLLVKNPSAAATIVARNPIPADPAEEADLRRREALFREWREARTHEPFFEWAHAREYSAKAECSA